MTLDEFLEAFEDFAPSLAWRIRTNLFCEEPYPYLRTPDDADGLDQCPLVAYVNAKHGTAFRSGQFSLAASRIGLALDATVKIVRAADGVPNGDPVLRRRLLAACLLPTQEGEPANEPT